MTFDPFGDFETRGYLRNYGGFHDLRAVKYAEHMSFLENLPQAVADLQDVNWIGHRHMLAVHKTLFQDVYPWAGQDRAVLAPHIAIDKGGGTPTYLLTRWM